MNKTIPAFKTDAEAEHFVDTADLSEYDLSDFKPMQFEVDQVAQLSMRVPRPLLDAVKDRARSRGVPYTRYIRELMERDVLEPKP